MENDKLNLDHLLGSHDDWEAPPEVPAEEIKQIRDNLRKRSIFTITVSVVLAAALLAATIWGVVPFVESLYWHPDDAAYKDRSDLQTTIHAYTELFQPGYTLESVTYQKTGFASWALDIPLSRPGNGEKLLYTGTLDHNTLTLGEQFLNSGNGYYFQLSRKAEYQETYIEVENNTAVAAQLQELPPYIQVEAAVSFSRDLSMEEFCDFLNRTYGYKLTWIPIRCFEPNGEWTPSCGMSPQRSGLAYSGLYADYPYFDLGRSGRDAGQLEQHFISLLEYAKDRLEEGRGIIPYEDPELYQKILDYVNENGIYTYGCVVYGSPEALLKLMEDEDVCWISLTDAWLNINYQIYG